MKRIFLVFVLVFALVLPVHAAYNMMEDISSVAWGGASCTPNVNSTTVAMTYDGDEATNGQATNCRISAHFTHNWTVDSCSMLYTLGGATDYLEIYTTNYTASPNGSTFTKGVSQSLMPKSTTGYYPTLITGQEIAMSPGDTSSWAMAEWSCVGTSTELPQTVSADFVASATSIVGPDYVSFTDNSTGYPLATEWNWSYSPIEGVMVAPGDLDNQDIAMYFTQDGNYTITHGVSNGGASDIETKTDYIWVHDTSELASIRVRAADAVSGYGINGAQVDVYDIENTSWTNTTTVAGEATVSILNGHTFNAYGSAFGYDDGEILSIPAVNGLYPIYMWPSAFATNTSEGNLTFYLTVLEDGTNNRLAGYGISLTTAAGGPGFTNGITNDNGIFQATIANKTTYYISIQPQKGHLGTSTHFYSGDAVGGGDEYVEKTVWLQLSSVTPTVTATTLPGGGTPAPTVDPYPCDADHPENCQRKQTELANILVEYGPFLVMFFILLTVVGGLKLMAKR